MPGVRCTIVELCVFKRTESGPLFLALKRSLSESLYPGMWQIITGKIRKAEKASTAALRELREETGLLARRFWVAPVVDSFYSLPDDAVEMCPVFAVEVAASAEPIISNEHQKYEWVTFERTRTLLVWPGHHEAIRVVHDYIVSGTEAARLTEIKLRVKERKTK